MDCAEVHSSIQRWTQEDSATTLSKVARFEMETSSWELPAGLACYIDKYMSHGY